MLSNDGTPSTGPKDSNDDRKALKRSELVLCHYYSIVEALLQIRYSNKLKLVT